MGVASLNGINFRVDPYEISWPYKILSNVTPTIGGKVVQILGVQLGDLTVTGTFGTGGWREEQQFLQQITSIAEAQTNVTGGKPVRFMYPPHGYDFQVFIKAISPINNTIRNFAPRWELTMFIQEDTLGITKSVKGDAMDAFIARLANGIGWKRSEYNGPLTDEDKNSIMAKAGADDVKTYLYGNFRVAEGLPREAPQGGGSSSSGSSSSSSSDPGKTVTGGSTTGTAAEHAKEVADVCKQLGLSRKGALICFITCIAESNFLNYANSKIPESLSIPHDAVGSDGYSVGLFQQQTGPFGDYWGTVAQCMDPKYATSRFIRELKSKVPNWESDDPGHAAQTVQSSAFPDRYDQQINQANQMLDTIGYK